jgi:hypothetical protein
MLGAGVTAPLATPVRWVPTCCTHAGPWLSNDGVIEFEASDGGPVPTELVVATVNVYAVPFVNPLTAALVVGGEPVTAVGVCAVEPMYGVIV